MTSLTTRTDVVLRADPSRVVARLFIPGNALAIDNDSRSGTVVDRILALPEQAVEDLVADIHTRWGSRHRDLPAVLAASYEHIAYRVVVGTDLSEARQTLLGAYFTQEQSIEAAALFNPSMVAHPDQTGRPPGHLRFVMSLRAVGEGHLSCIEFRTGTVDADGQVQLDDPGSHAEVGTASHGTYARSLFAASLADAGVNGEAAAYLVSQLPDTFNQDDLDRALMRLDDSQHISHDGVHTDSMARRIARCTYRVEFPSVTTIGERVLRPNGPTESQGMEDARFVRVQDDDGSVTYRGTYTAFDGRHIAPQLIQTEDFRRFRISVLAGPSAVDKGLALFPRTVGGKHLAITRSDRETTGVASSSDGYWWSASTPLHRPSLTWDLIQTGNCGSPIETEAGWLVLTHGVGPMREYCIGALLLDLEDPTRVIGTLDEPLLRPQADEREGYVPNVVYSCGSLRHGDRLVLPYGFSDAGVRFAVVDLPELIALLLRATPERH